jgi:hypothetical protein
MIPKHHRRFSTRLSKLVRVTGMLENLNICFSSKIRRGSDFLLYGNKNVPSAEILRGRRCQP